MISIDSACIDTIRLLAADAVQKASSGHPGMPMGAAPMAHVLWTRHLRFSPADPEWYSRDRFILSAGHGSMLLYSLLYLSGFGLTMEDVQQFRQLGSRTPGHPEYGHAPGVEITTGPLGQGFAAGVGMAIAQRHLAARFHRPGHEPFDYRIYGIVSDGDLMEGVASEAASLAGHLKLGNIIYLYDDNHITIDGPTEIAFTEDRAKRFEAYGWHVQTIDDGNDIGAIDRAISAAKKIKGKPSLICVRTVIGYGSPNKQGTASSHGAPLGIDEVKLTKKFFNRNPEQQFVVPDAVLAHYRTLKDKGIELHRVWNRQFEQYRADFPQLAAEFDLLMRAVPEDALLKELPVFSADGGALATRQASEKAIQVVAERVPGLIGGSADLAESNLTTIKGGGEIEPLSYGGRNLRFGVREHAMAAILNGLALTKGLVPFGGTFLIFSDYMRPSIRLAALMGIGPIYVFTHDSIGLGEDGPTHQPVEQLASLRAIPNMTVIRPADANETSVAWFAALQNRTGPTALALSRQKLPVIDRAKYAPAGHLLRGAYVLAQTSDKPALILIATGSEVHSALAAYERLAAKGISVRLVSFPSWELFEQQSESYKESVLPRAVTKRIAVEAAVQIGWERYIGREGKFIGMQSFGASAPYEALMKHFGITAEHIYEVAWSLL